MSGVLQPVHRHHLLYRARLLLLLLLVAVAAGAGAAATHRLLEGGTAAAQPLRTATVSYTVDGGQLHCLALVDSGGQPRALSCDWMSLRR